MKFLIILILSAAIWGGTVTSVDAFDLNKMIKDVFSEPEKPQQQHQEPQVNQPSEPPPPATVSPQANKREAAMELQRSLNTLGFDAGPVDGLPGRRTAAAVRAFQASRGFPVTGELTSLQRLSLVTEAIHAEADDVTAPAVRQVAAQEVQSYLAARGYPVGAPDGVWGPQSQQALDAFRHDLGAGAMAQGTPPTQSDRAALYAQVHGTPPVFSLAGHEPNDVPPLNTEPATTTQPILAVNSGAHVNVRGWKGNNGLPPELSTRLNRLGLKWRPEQLGKDDVVLDLYFKEQIETTGLDAITVRQQFQALNNLQKEDVIADARNRFILEAQQTPDIAPGSPLKLAFLSRPLLSNQIRFEEGKGLKFGSSANLRGRFFHTPLRFGSSYDYAPMTRDAAKELLDQAQAAWDSNQEAVVQVFWVTVTGFGPSADANLSSTAPYTPISFQLDRATLHLRNRDDATPVLLTNAIYIWPDPKAREPATVGDRPTSLELATRIGLPVAGGYVVSDWTQNRLWGRFNLLAAITRDPDYFRQGTRFVPLMMLLDPSDRRVLSDSIAIQRPLAPSLKWAEGDGEKSVRDSLQRMAFPDEFQRAGAKDMFFERYWAKILQQTPHGPLPVQHIMQGNIEEYDFAGGFFPVRFSMHQSVYSDPAKLGLRVAATPDPRSGGLGFVSADRFASDRLPQRLHMSREEAEAFRARLRGNSIYLAWWSDLDWSADGTAEEQAFLASVQSSARSPSTLAQVRANLTRIAIFTDQALTDPILELDPANLLLPVPDPPKVPDKPVAETPSDEVRDLLANEVVTGLGYLQAAADASPDPSGVVDAYLGKLQQVRRADEFNRRDMLRDLREQAKAERPEGAFWLAGGAELGKYDIESGEFSLRYGISPQVADGHGLPIGTRIANADKTLRVPTSEDLARRILAEEKVFGNRAVAIRMRARLQGATLPYGKPERAEAILVAEEIVFLRQYPRADLRAPVIIGRVSFADAIAAATARQTQTFQAADFAGSADMVPVIDAHILDLLKVRERGLPESEDALLETMVALKHHEASVNPIPGPRFFADGVSALADTQGNTDLQRIRALQYLPRLQSFLTAKAAALGDVLAVEFRPHERNTKCDRFQDYINYVGEGPAVRRVAVSREDQQQVEQLRSRSNGVARIDRRVLAMIERTRSQNLHRACEPLWAMLSIKDALVASHRRYPQGVRLEFEVENISFFPFQYPDRRGATVQTETLLIEAKAISSHALRADGAAGERLVETPYVDPADQRRLAREKERQAEAARRQQEADAKAAAAARQQQAAAPPVPAPGAAQGQPPGGPQGEWPNMDGFEVTLSDRDILGLRIGQDMADADRILRARGGLIAAFETPAPPPAINALGYRRVYVLRDGMEAITLASYRPDGKVLAIMRRMVLQAGRLPYDQITDGLNRKYGASDIDEPIMGMRSWGNAALPEDCLYTYGQGGSNHLHHMKQLVPGEGSTDVDFIRSPDVTSYMKGLPELVPELIANTEVCGQVLIYTPEYPEQWGKSGFSLMLADFTQVIAAQDYALRNTGETKVKIEF